MNEAITDPFDGHRVNVFRDGEGNYVAHFVEMPNVSAFADSPEDALNELAIAWQAMKESYARAEALKVKAYMSIRDRARFERIQQEIARIPNQIITWIGEFKDVLDYTDELADVFTRQCRDIALFQAHRYALVRTKAPEGREAIYLSGMCPHDLIEEFVQRYAPNTLKLTDIYGSASMGYAVGYLPAHQRRLGILKGVASYEIMDDFKITDEELFKL